ncbi:MAG TPA: GH92 family glycosyl hydrolase [Bacteroidales bacterium]|nr:GH92 family glycosyl hydrolase [Bacteroidales bacterium]
MNNNLLKYGFLLLMTCLVFPGLFGREERSIDFVNPFIGTGAVASSLSGNNFPGATVPFGMVQLSPDTRNAPDWGQASGYDYNDSTIYGFSHTHLSGTGVAELFDVLVLPFTGDTEKAASALKSDKGFYSTFSHAEEKAQPGYYRVFLKTFGVQAELTSTTRCGMQRLHYPENAKSQVLVDLNHSLNKGSWSTTILNSQIKVVNAFTLEGYRVITGWAKMRKVYFCMRFSKPMIGNVLIKGTEMFPGLKVADGTNLKGLFEFSNQDGQPLLVKTGISAVSLENARLNLFTEIPNWNFDRIRTLAQDRWETELVKVKIEGTPKQKEVFYTALYHAFLQPNTFSDVNGEYMTAAFSTRKLDDGDIQFSTFSLWDTYRAAHPLYTLLQPERSANFVNSLIRHAETAGYLPVWQLWGQDNFCMIGNHAIPVVVDAVLKGLPGIDPQKAYAAVYASATNSHLNSPFEVWEKFGYMPENIQSQSVSITLEMAYDDWCVAQLAKKLGQTSDYERFNRRAQFYGNLFNAATGFFQPKDDQGNWMVPFNPLTYGANGGHPFTEGNAWQYFWYVPHHISDLIARTGGDLAFVKKLDTFFSLLNAETQRNDNASGFIGQYAHGNEPSHHIAYLYDYAGQPSRTQYYTHKIMTEWYNTSSSGYAGNEDCGQMSSWYVFSSLGFYPVNPASGIYAIGTPLFKSASIQLPNGKKMEILTENNSEQNFYIQSARLNDKPFDHCYLTHKELLEGGKLVFKMGPKPSKNWGKAIGNRPIESCWP